MDINRREIFNMFRGHCAYCGDPITFSHFTIDHIIPVSHGRNDDPLNLNPCCKSCNSIKGSRDLEEFRTHLKEYFSKITDTHPKVGLLEKLGVVNYNFKNFKFFFETKQSFINEQIEDISEEEFEEKIEQERLDYIEEVRLEAARIEYVNNLRKDAIQLLKYNKRRKNHYSHYQMSK